MHWMLATMIAGTAAQSASDAAQNPVRERFAAAIAAVGDIDGGGVPEIAVAIATGSLLYSGETGSLAWRSSARATSFAPIGDYDGDGVRDLAVAFIDVRIVSGATGAVLGDRSCGTMLAPGLHLGSLGVVDGFDDLLVESAERVERLSLRPDAPREAIAEKRSGTPGLHCALPGEARDIAFVDWRGTWDPSRSLDGPPSLLRLRPGNGGPLRDLAQLCANEWKPRSDDPCAGADGYELASAGDVDGDGRADVLVAAVGATVRTISTREGATLATFLNPRPGGYQSWFGGSIVALGDLDGDGADDVAIGCRDESGGTSAPFAAVFSGRSGARLSVLPHESHDGDDHLVAAPGDVDRDGRADVAVLVRGSNTLTIYSGASFEPIRVMQAPIDATRVPPGAGSAASSSTRAPVPPPARLAAGSSRSSAGFVWVEPSRLAPKRDAPRPAFGEALSAVGDVDSDGVRDIAVVLARGLALYSGKSGRLLWWVRGDVRSVAPIDDADGDGAPDVIVAERAALRIVSGRDGREVVALPEAVSLGVPRDVDPLGDLDGDGRCELLVVTPAGGRVVSTGASSADTLIPLDPGLGDCHPMRAVGDVDGDGRTDIGWIAWGNEENGAGRKLHVRVTSAVTRSTILDVPLVSCPAEDGFTIAAAGDMDADGRGDVLVVSQSNCAKTLSGRDGRILAMFDDPCPGGYIEGFGDTAVALGDLDGDHVSEIAFGSKEYLDSGDDYYAAVCSGRTGELLRVIRHEHRPGHFHFVAAPGDVNGDELPDLAVLVPDCGSLTLYSGKDWSTIRTLVPPSD